MKTLPKAVMMASYISVYLAMAGGQTGLKIVVNPNVQASTVSSDDLTRIFLITKTSLNGSHVEPVIERDSAVYQIFLKQYLGKTDSALTIYYRSLVFTGKAFMPKSFRSDAELVAYVAKNKGAIGFVKADANIAAVKTLQVN